MLTKLAALVKGKVALAVLGTLLVGSGTAALVAAHGASSSQHNESGGTNQNAQSGDQNHAHTVSMEGVLKAYNAGGHTVSVLSIGATAATSVAVNSTTRVNGEHASSLADLAKNIGHKVEVAATKQSNGSLLAWKITVQGADGNQGQSASGSDDHSAQNAQRDAEGKITSLANGSFVVMLGNGTKISVTVTAATTFEGSVHSFAGLKVGMRVNVHGTSQANGSLLASTIEGESDR